MSIFYNNFAKELKKEDLEFNKDIEEYKMYINNGKKLAINYINCMASCLYVTGTINIMKVKFDDLLNLIPDDVAIEVFNYYYAYKEEYFTKDNNEDILYIRTFLANLVDFAFFYTSYNKIEFKLFDDDVIDKRTIASSIYVFKNVKFKYLKKKFANILFSVKNLISRSSKCMSESYNM